MVSVASKSSTYLQSLVDYVLDVKPFHTKLSVAGAVSETYIFSDTLTVTLTDSHAIKSFLGADLLPAEFSSAGVRLRQSDSWVKDIISDGVRSVWPIPTISNPKFASLARQERFVGGVDDISIIPGLATGVFNARRWDGPGITEVRINGEQQQDSIDYTLSHGIFSFDILPTKQWRRSDLDYPDDLINGHLNPFGGTDGTLLYSSVVRAGGSLIAITGATYEEFKAVCIANIPTALLRVYAGPGFTEDLGTVEFGDTFTAYVGGNPLNDIRIQFTFTYAPSQVVETAQVNDEWIITPENELVVHPDAPEETWSLIKSNPIVFASGGEPEFIPAVPRDPDDNPAISIYTRSLEFTSHPSGTLTWTLTFNGAGLYTLDTDLPDYPKVMSLVDGCSYRDDNIAFTIIPTVTGWRPNDQFTWTTTEDQAHYKVFGSVSGWQDDAVVGQWYFNGFVGFKIPELRYHVNSGLAESTQFTALRDVSVMAEPSCYTITFTTASDTVNGIPAKAKVHNNLYGYNQNLVTGEPYTDDYVSFQIDATVTSEFSPGDVVKIYLTPTRTFMSTTGFEVDPYESAPFDVGQQNLTVPYLFNGEVYPLYYGHGAVIMTQAQADDEIIINKTFTDRLRFRLDDSVTAHPELGAEEDWIPMFFRYSDVVEDDVPTSTAEYSDLGMYLEAFSAATGDRIFHVLSPRYLKTNRTAVSTLVFDTDFFETYMPYNREYTLMVIPDITYGQKLRVKISEALKVYALIQLNLEDLLTVSVSDAIDWFTTAQQIDMVDLVNVEFVEGGAHPVNGYDAFSYDTFPYGFESAYAIAIGDVHVPIPALILGYYSPAPGVYEWMGNPEDVDSIPVVTSVNPLPPLPDISWPEGTYVRLTSDNRYYRSTGDEWEEKGPYVYVRLTTDGQYYRSNDPDNDWTPVTNKNWILPNATPATLNPDPFHISQAPDDAGNIAASSVTEGLTILLTAVNTGSAPQTITTDAVYLTALYDFNLTNVAAAGIGPFDMRGLVVGRIWDLDPSPFLVGPLPAGSQITVKMKNVDLKSYPNGDPPSDCYVGYGGADLDSTVIGPIPIVTSYTEIDTGTTLTDPDSFDINVDVDATGLEGPFRIWIV